MLRRKVIFFSLAGGFGFVAAFLVALQLLGSPAVGLADRPAGDAGSTRLRLAPDAELVRWCLFEDGTRGGPIVSTIPAELAGLTSTELADGHAHWRLISFAQNRVVVEEYCAPPIGGFLRSEQGMLVVYTGAQDGCFRQVGMIELDVDRISPLHVEELARGVSFSSESELALILEGIAAP